MHRDQRGRGRGRGRYDQPGRRGDYNNDRRNDRRGDGRDNDGGGAQPRRTYHMGYRKLTELHNQDPKDVLMYLNNKNNNFKVFLDSEETPTKPDCIELTMNILNTCMEERTMTDILNSVLNEVIKSKFVVPNMCTVVMNMAIERRRDKQEQYQRILKGTLRLFEKLMLRIPTQAYAPVFQWSSTLESLIPMLKGQTIIIDDDILSSVRSLKESTEFYLRNASVTTQEYQSVYDNKPPPDDFRQLSTIPTKDDLHIKEEPFLRVNKDTGAYNDVDHYLDVQYRLLREDFIAPLREGIEEYLQQKPNSRKRLSNVIVYENVRFIKPQCSSSGIVYTLQLDMTGPLAKIRWKSSKRLIFGSLVCLSKDRFDTFLIATVHERKVDILESKGQITVQLPDLNDLKDRCNFEATYVMLETTAYFESYRHVLKGLQEIDDNMAFKEHIVYCSEKVKPPTYLTRIENVKLNFTTILPDDTPDRIRREFESVPALAPTTWPQAHHLSLDLSQWKALVNAITKRLSIVQGPPGTGKTFIGLKVAKLLLSNYKVWADDGEAMRPILVVCYTNHALDQFLEGILTFTETNEIVRVGGRSKSTELEACMLKTLRQHTDKRDKHVAGAFQALRDNKDQLFLAEDQITHLAKQTENAHKSILTSAILEEYMTDQQRETLAFDFNQGRDVMKEWLGFANVNLSKLLRRMQMEERDVEGEDEEEPDIMEEADVVEAERALDIDDDWIEILGDAIGSHLVHDEEDDPEWGNLTRKEKQALKSRLQELIGNPDAMSKEEAENVTDAWRLRDNDRWRLYRYWKGCHLADLNEKVDEQHSAYMDLIRQRNEIMNEKDATIMRNAKVIGMTTTGCARYRKMLQRIQPRIVIVEEAAEVLEAHIVTSLSESCEHLIMIGDHKQLRPNPAVYKLAKKFKLEISLFERMIKNKLPFECLQIQHRMKPIICEPMRFIYPEIIDAESVKKFDDVLGVSTNMYYIDHGHPEESCSDTRSHANRHEAEFMVHLCRYLLQQGYDPSQVTILTPYYGQLVKFKDYIKHKHITELNNVRITVVDNFQGEENDIILLSLVRSNSDGSIGFLGTDNRVCVALSRAKKGLFVIGNFQLLKSKTDLWTKIEQHMVRNGMIGEELELKCQIHEDDVGVKVSKASDFDRVSEGGCNRMCEFRLQCGHTCPRQCHIYDRDHIDMAQRCIQPCARNICGNKNHRCRKRCKDDCGPCQYPTEKILPKCGHTQIVKCGENLDVVPCKQPCPKKLACGHGCPAGCSRPCTEPCTVPMARRLKCGHVQKVPCFKPIAEAVCRETCPAKLECGHDCSGNCQKCYGGHLHRSCTSKCERILVCGHICREPCTKECPPCPEQCHNRCVHSKCQKKCGEACIPCNEHCQWQCQHKRCSKLCHELCDRDRCNKPCTRVVPPRKKGKRPLASCGHPCIGLCGEPCPKLCRVCDRSTVEEIFFGDEDEPETRFVELSDCGHVISVSGLDHWMDTSTDDSKNAIQLKKCPRCNVEIRQHLRYGNIVKNSLRDVEQVKEKIRGKAEDNINDVEFIRQAILNVTAVVNQMGTTNRITLLTSVMSTESAVLAFPKLNDLWQNLRQFMRREKPTECPRSDVAVRRIKAQILERLSTIMGQFKAALSKEHIYEHDIPEYTDFVNDIEYLASYVLWNDNKTRSGKSSERSTFSEQQVTDIEFFATRLHQLSKFLIMNTIMKRRGQQDKTDTIEKCRLLLTKSIPYREAHSEEVTSLLRKMEKMCNVSGLGITDEERKMILRVMGLAKGHWYKCPKGHVYAIGECGGAQQESTCPECGNRIGGTGHRLLSDNAVATEMDGARYSAFSDQANMDNYDRGELERLAFM